VGQFDFTDEQLAAKQKDLQGVAMPNFGDARNTLAKEASWEPEEPEESEEEGGSKPRATRSITDRPQYAIDSCSSAKDPSFIFRNTFAAVCPVCEPRE
jgi:hypothetical protein